MADDNYNAEEALTLIRELRLAHNALERRSDSGDRDRIRLGERVTSLSTQLEEHEATQRSTLRNVNQALTDLGESLRRLRDLAERTVAAPPVPTGTALIESWRQTPAMARVKISTVIVAALMAPEVLKGLGAWLLSLIQ